MLDRVLLAMAVIVLTARVVGWLFARVGQPEVIGEIVGGIVLGPTLIGASLDRTLFPADVLPALSVVGQLGLVLYMFTVGLHLNVRLARREPRSVSLISAASVAAPFALAMPLAALLYSHDSVVHGQHVRSVVFFLFFGTALSITAFPVLARILEERRLQHTRIGILATACAAAQDVAGWLMLAAVLTVARADSGVGGIGKTALGSVGCVIGILLLAYAVGFLNKRVAAIRGVDPDHRGQFPLLYSATLIALLVSAAATQAVGLHAVFGAFLFGAALRRPIPVAAREPLRERILPLTRGLLLPIYFIIPGLSVNLRSVGGREALDIVLILIVACGGKLGGAYLTSRAAGLRRADAAMMGALMNTRGLIELVVLQVALASQIIGDTLFSEMVVVAVVTTLMTQPLMSLILRRDSGASSAGRVDQARDAVERHEVRGDDPLIPDGDAVMVLQEADDSAPQ